jgi:hypothetical protein
MDADPHGRGLKIAPEAPGCPLELEADPIQIKSFDFNTASFATACFSTLFFDPIM